MTVTQARSVFQELAELFASHPSKRTVLEFRPSKALQRQAQRLLSKQDRGRSLTEDEQRQFDEFMQAELFMRLVKAKLRANKEVNS